MKKTSLLLSLLFPALLMMGQISVEQLSYANMPACDGVIEVFAEGTAGPFTVKVVQYGEIVHFPNPTHIPEGEGSVIIPGLCDGKHVIEVTNRFGCTTSITKLLNRCEFKITKQPGIVRKPTGCGATDGEIRFFSDAGLKGGTGPYTYNWTNREGEVILPEQGQNLHIKHLGSSIYTLTVEDVNGCKATANYDLLSENEPDAYGVPTASCEGEDNGVVSLVATMPGLNGGQVNFEWSTGVVIENNVVGTIENLSPGTYTVTISDPQGNCSIERSYVIEERASTGLFNFTSSIGLSCASDNNGSINLQASGGNPPYQYRWDEWATFGASRSGLAGGIYCVTITDDCDREIRECFDIALPEPEIEIVLVVDCNSYLAEGQLLAIVDGGISPFSYSWSNGRQGPIISNLTNKGIYTLTVTDANNCKYIKSYNLLLPEMSIGDVYEPCEGFFDGEITIKVANPFNEEASIIFDNGLAYQFAVGEETHTFSGLEGGIIYDYIATIGDCTLERDFTLDEKPTDKVFNEDASGAEASGICTFNEECDGELINEDSYFSDIDYRLYSAQGGFLDDCAIAGFCGDTEVTAKEYSKKSVRALEYFTVLLIARESSGWDLSYINQLISKLVDEDLENCDRVRYCPATLQLLQTWDWPWNGGGSSLPSPEGCLNHRCGAGSNINFCANEDVPDYFHGYEGVLPAEPSLPNNCSLRRLRVIQLTYWDQELEHEFGDEYMESTLKEFVDNVNSNYSQEPTICAEVVFCRDEFKFISSNIDEVNCLGAFVNDSNGETRTYCTYWEASNGWSNAACFRVGCICSEDDCSDCGQQISIGWDFPGNGFFSVPDDHIIKVIEGTTIKPSNFVNLGKGIADGRVVGKGLFENEENGIYNDFSHRSTIASRIKTRNIIEYIIEWDNNEVLYIEQHGVNKFQLWREAGGSSWAEVLTSEKMEISHLSKKKDIIYVGGTFEGALIFGDEKLTDEKKYAGFLLEINGEGRVLNRQIVENINPSTDFLIVDGLQGILLSGESQETAIEVNGHFEEMQDGGIFNVKVSAGSVTTNSEMRTQGDIKTKKVIQALENTKKTYLFKGEGSIAVGGINYTTNARDAAVINVNANGTRKWFKRFRSTNGGEIKSMDIVSGDHESVYVGLTFTGGLISNRVRFASKGGEDILIFKLDDRGKVIDYKQYGTIEDERIMELLYDSGSLYFGGEFSGQESDRLIGRIKYVNHSNTYNNAYVSYLFDTDFGKTTSKRSEDTDMTNDFEKAMIAMPNPFSDQITIEANDESISQLAIYNTLGEQVATSTLTNDRTWKVNFSDIPKGLYILQATDEKGRTVAVESIVHQ